MIKFDRNDVGALETTSGEDDCLAIVLCTYYSKHQNRPEGDEETEGKDNYHWGDWVIAQCDKAMDEYAEQLNEELGRRVKSNPFPS